MSNIKIEFPDGAKKEFATATTVREVAATISNSLAKKAVGANFAGKVVGLNHQLKSDGKLAILTKDQPEALPILWQTGAVVLGAALQELYSRNVFWRK
jgi:threonyl-tRNA synthetase